MKRIFVFFCLIFMAVWAGCQQSVTYDLSKTVTDTNAPPVNLAADIALASKENKLLLLEFGSSDSCPPCIAFQQNVFSTPEFLNYEKSNLVFVRLDFPQKVNLKPNTIATNLLLAQQFNAYGYPTFIALDKNGKEFWREEGLTMSQLDNPTNFIALIESARAKQK